MSRDSPTGSQRVLTVGVPHSRALVAPAISAIAARRGAAWLNDPAAKTDPVASARVKTRTAVVTRHCLSEVLLVCEAPGVTSRTSPSC